MTRMPEAGDRKRDLSIPEKAEIIFSDHGREARENIGFLEAFRDLSTRLADAYHVSDDIYSQTASSSRLEEGTSINRAKEFLNHVDYNPNKAGDIVKDFAKTHKPTKVYLGRGVPINLGVNIGSDELLSMGPESHASGRSSTIAALAQRAARLESLLAPEGIPEVYATAQGQVGRALKVVEKAALLAYDWNTNWGSLDVKTALDQAKSVLTKQKIIRAGLAIALSLAGCDALPPILTAMPDLNTPTAGEVTPAETVPGIETPSPTDFQPTPTDIYHFGSGGPINQEMLNQMEAEDPTVAKQITWLNQWEQWYDSADPSIRPMTADEAKNSIVFYKWTGTDGSTHYKAAWKFDTGYPGYVLVPAAINWEGLNPPVTAAAGHEIGPGQGPVKISTECLEGSDLAKLGVPVGAKLAPEQGTGNWVMVFYDKVVARVDASGVWRMEAILPTNTPVPSETPIPTEKPAARQVELVFAPDGTIVPDSCKVVPDATADNTLTLNGQPLPDGTVIDQSVGIVSVSSGNYELPTLLIAARAVAIEKISPVYLDNMPVDRYLICFNVKLPSGDNVVLASVFVNDQASGFQNTFVYELPGVDIAGVEIDLRKPNATLDKTVTNAAFVNLFISGRIIGQQVLLPFEYNYPAGDGLAYQNPARAAIVNALKDGTLPPAVGFDPVVINTIGRGLVVPKNLIP